MKISRRTLLKRTALSTALAALPSAALAASRQPLRIPPLLDSRRGKPVLLGIESTQRKLDGEHLVEVWGFNGQYLGPTLRVRKGDFVKLNYHNSLSQTVAMNIQGLQVGSDSLGGIGHSLKSGESWAPIVHINQNAATCYYQACSLANSAYQNYRGLVGLWIVEDDESRKAQLPNKYGVNDIPLILQDLRLNSEGLQLFQQNEPHFRGNRLFVNGQESPFIKVARGWVRLRLLNASLSRPYELRLDDERDFVIIAQDQGFLPEPKTVKSALLGVGERMEILIDLNEGGNVSLLAGKKRGFFDKIGQLFEGDDHLVDNTILELRPEGLISVFTQKPDFKPLKEDFASLQKQIVQQRQFQLDPLNSMINQKRFDPRRIDVNAKRGSIERWTIHSTEPTGFRIQGAKFLVESLNDQATPPQHLVWKDTVWVDKNASLLVKFDNVSSSSKPFIFGAADLMQADKGAIGLLVVQ